MDPLPSVELHHVLAALLSLALTLVAAGHAILFKRDVRAAIGWVTVIVLVPVGGPVAYGLLGINRLRRRASALAIGRRPGPDADRRATVRVVAGPGRLDSLARLGEGVVRRPLRDGNSVMPLRDGDEAYPEMLHAIDEARRSVALMTYIFDNDAVGEQFLAALVVAQQRGVEVRVLVDAVGARYSWPSMATRLKRAGVPVARFLPTLLPWRLAYLNLRNHRKLLVADGLVAFLGGMNLRTGHLLLAHPPHPVRDLHFRVEGPVVGDLQDVFAQDWRFAGGESLQGEAWFPEQPLRGTVAARATPDGPDEDFETVRWMLLGALACAQESVRIATPYFIPDVALVTSLNVAAMRGVRVEVLLPARGNLALVEWAATAQLWQILEKGCRVFLSPPPFDHSKLMVVDGRWSFIGSANWDPRSLRLNFELNVSCHDADLATRLAGMFDERRAVAHELTLEDVDARPLAVRLRDGAARLLSPYL